MTRFMTPRIALFAGLFLATAFAAPHAAAAPPVLNLPGAQNVAEGVHLTFNVSATDPDGQTVELYAANLPSGASFVDNRNNTGRFDWTPATDQAGSYLVYFLADDTFGGTDDGTVQIDVSDANSPPVLSSIGDRSVEQGTTQFVSLSGFDADGDALTFTSGALPPYATLTDYGDGTGNLTLAPTLSTPTGPTSITVTLSDGHSNVSETFIVTVTGSTAAHPPILSSIGNQSVAEGEIKQVAVSATDPDGGVLSWSVSLPGFATLTTTGSGPGALSGTLDLTPGYCHAGTYSAHVAVSDGGLQDFEDFSITVGNVNRSPAWDETAYAASVPEGSSASVAVSASDPDGLCGQGAPVLSLVGSDGGEALAATLTDLGGGSGTVSLTAGSQAAGLYHVTLRAADAADASLGQNVVLTVTVTDVASVPTARAWSESDPLRLHTGKPRERLYLEPVEGSFNLGSVNRSTIQLASWGGTGSVSSIAPIPETLDAEHDRDGNGVLELRMDFTKEDLRLLFDYVTERVAGQMTLNAVLENGTRISAVVNVSVFPERKGVIKRVGPNPLNPDAVVTVRTERDGDLRVRVFDVNGRLARTLLDVSGVPAGEHLVRFDGRDDRGAVLPSGRYFVQAETPYERDVIPITILK